MAWRIAQSLLTLLAEVNALYPDRYKGTDGGISGYTYGPGGVIVNPNNQSSHNINSAGVVCAFDITTGNYPGGISVAAGQALAEQIRIRVRDQPRGITFYGIHYMAPPYVAIAGPKICTYGNNWEWENYGGSDPHTSHQHWSADWDVFPGGAPSGLADYDSTLPWNLTRITGQGTGFEPIQEDDMALSDADKEWIGHKFYEVLQDPVVIEAQRKLLFNDTSLRNIQGTVKRQLDEIQGSVGFQEGFLVETLPAIADAAGATVDIAAVEKAARAGAQAALAAGVKIDATVTVAGTK